MAYKKHASLNEKNMILHNCNEEKTWFQNLFALFDSCNYRVAKIQL